MPRIDDGILQSIFYLYPSVEDAESGEEIGGTGFRVSIASETHPDRVYVYGVSNAHVVGNPGYSPIIRWNDTRTTVPGGTIMIGDREIIPRAINQWTPHPNGDDLAITPLGSLDGKDYATHLHRVPRCIPSFLLLSHEAVRGFDIGPGDDVYMIGRFIHHAGKHYNRPSVRSGIISLMPDYIEIEPKVFQEAFLIEMRSISGHSGSPVMFKMRITAADLLAHMSPQTSREILDALGERFIKPGVGPLPMGPWLIGVDCADFKYYNDVVDRNNVRTELKAKSHAGQSVVIPAWKLTELLNLDEFVLARKQADEELSIAKAAHPVQLN